MANHAEPPRTAREAVDRVGADMAAFAAAEAIDHLIVLNISSTEPPFAVLRDLGDRERLAKILGR